MTQRQHVPTTEYPPTPHKFWFQQSIPTHHNPTGGAILALGEPSPGGAHFHLHRFLSLGIRPLFCSYLLRPPPPHSSWHKVRGGEREEKSRRRSRRLLGGEEEEWNGGSTAIKRRKTLMGEHLSVTTEKMPLLGEYSMAKCIEEQL